jgi:hypothetical protein
LALEVGLAVQAHEEGGRAADHVVDHDLGDERYVDVAPLEGVEEEAESFPGDG